MLKPGNILKVSRKTPGTLVMLKSFWKRFAGSNPHPMLVVGYDTADELVITLNNGRVDYFDESCLKIVWNG